MMACTPSALHRGKAPKVVKEGGSVSLPEVKVPVLTTDSVTLPALIDSISTHQDEVKEMVDSVASAIAEEDVAPLDSIIPDGAEAAIKTKRDTTTMDSLELAIYKHNKAVDDSLALDSINRHRKNGIDAPVEYSADDGIHYPGRPT